MGHVVHSGASHVRNIDALSGWARCGYDKKDIGIRYAEFVFLHVVGSTGHLVCSVASEARNIDAIFFMLRVGLVRTARKAH
jgi:hypothetical protein